MAHKLGSYRLPLLPCHPPCSAPCTRQHPRHRSGLTAQACIHLEVGIEVNGSGTGSCTISLPHPTKPQESLDYILSLTGSESGLVRCKIVIDQKNNDAETAEAVNAGYYDTHLVASQDAEASYEVIDGKVLASTQHASTGSDTLAGGAVTSAPLKSTGS